MYSKPDCRLAATTPAARIVACLFLSFAFAAPALAHGASPKKVDEKIAIAAKPAAVWAIIGNFVDIAKWNPLVAKSVAKTDKREGKERVITLKSGGQITDALTDYNAAKMTYSYLRADDNVKVFPVSFYSATISLQPTATGTEVEWVGRFYRGVTGNNPPPGMTDADATKAMKTFFDAGLRNLKKLAEKK